MKTTVDLPDELLAAAKEQAAHTQRPLRSLIIDGLRAQLAASSKPSATGARNLRWVVADGGLPPVDIDDRERMHEWLRRPQ